MDLFISRECPYSSIEASLELTRAMRSDRPDRSSTNAADSSASLFRKRLKN